MEGRAFAPARHRDELARYLTRLLGDPDRAEDVVQETFLRWLERPPPDGRNPRAWLYAVAMNLVRDGARAASRRDRLLLRHRDRVPGPAPAPDPEDRVVRRERAIRVRRALAELAERDRAVLLMREEGFTHREIAEAVGSTTQSIGTMIARALDKLAHVLEPETEES